MAETVKKGGGYRGHLVVVVITVITLFIVRAGFGIVDRRTDRPEYCTSCHAMKFPAEEFQQSRHYKSKSGISPNCVDCHIPKGDDLAKFRRVIGDGLAQITGPKTKEEFEKRRPELAKRVRDYLHRNDSRTCRQCHIEQAMKSDNTKAMDAHKKLVLKGLNSGMIEEKKTCIDCHYNLVHAKVEVK